MNACLVMETDVGTNHKKLLDRLGISLLLSAKTTLSPSETSRLHVTPSLPYALRNLGALLRTSDDLHHIMIDHRAKSVE